MDQEADTDIREVCLEHDLDLLIRPKHEEYQQKVIADIRQRLSDSASFHHLRMGEDELEVVFQLREYV